MLTGTSNFNGVSITGTGVTFYVTTTGTPINLLEPLAVGSCYLLAAPTETCSTIRCRAMLVVAAFRALETRTRVVSST